MSGHEERRVKARHEVTQYYQRRGVKRTSSHQDLPRGDMMISDNPSPGNSNSGSDDDIEDESYVPFPRARPHGKGVAGPSGNGSRAARDEEIEVEIEEEEGDGDGDDKEEEEFDVDEINPSSYTHMGTPTFQIPLNPDWKEKINYKGKIDLVREKRKENPRLVEKEPDIDVFQQDFYESIIITKTKPVALSQWIN
jgi:hypothetical protein